MSEFDIGRASLKHPDFFQRFTVTGTGTALKGLGLNKKKSLLVFQRNAEKRALIQNQMLYHHAAQGELAGEPYVISF